MTNENDDVSRNNGPATGRDSAGRFTPGNSGRPRGARHKVTVACEALIEGQAERLTQLAIDRALGGDAIALRFVLERVLAPVRSRPMGIDLPSLDGPGAGQKVVAELVKALASGDIDSEGARQAAELVELHRRCRELDALSERLATLENRLSVKGP